MKSFSLFGKLVSVEIISIKSHNDHRNPQSQSTLLVQIAIFDWQLFQSIHEKVL